MIVPNYVPEPLEVGESIAEEPYMLRVAFIRRVTLYHLAGLFVVTGLGDLPWPRVGLYIPLGLLAALLIGLDVWRILRRGQPNESTVSSMFLPLIGVLAGWTLHEMIWLGWPCFAPLIGVGCAALFTLIAGRDFSFVGAMLVCQILSSVVLAAWSVHFNLDPRYAATALAANAIYLFYFEYDLASLLARRRRGEELGAVVDLYRDIFNIFGYILRVWRHWRKHKIWEAVR